MSDPFYFKKSFMDDPLDIWNSLKFIDTELLILICLQSAYGEPGITYRYSGTTVPAKSWSPGLAFLRDLVEKHSGVRYNFVLVNKYRVFDNWLPYLQRTLTKKDYVMKIDDLSWFWRFQFRKNLCNWKSLLYTSSGELWRFRYW